ncbi:hypothetical protein ACHAWF_008945 [Thalassiosira exigua]
MTAAAAPPPPPPSRAYAPHVPSWQRFHVHAAPLASSSGAGSAASDPSRHPYARQYSHVYSARLAALRDRCVASARRSLADGTEDAAAADRIIEAKEGAWSILVGTIAKEVDPSRRPKAETSFDEAPDATSFLFPPAEGGRHRPQEPLRHVAFDKSKGDVLHLEDESGRVELAPEGDDEGGEGKGGRTDALDPDAVATGVVAAVVGRACASTGVMKVRSIHFAGPPPVGGGDDGDVRADDGDARMRGPGADGEAADEEPALLLVSGLECGSDAPGDATAGASLALRREMLLDYLTDPAVGASVCRVVVAGGGVAPPPSLAEGEDEEHSAAGRKGGARAKRGKGDPASARAAASLRDLDLYLAELLAGGVPVDYVPGVGDPTNANWPQRPVHSCLLPLSCGYVDAFRRGTNPYESVLGGGGGDGTGAKAVRVLGSDGLNVADLRRFLAAPKSSGDGGASEAGDDEGEGKEEVPAAAASALDALNRTLIYSHAAPTGPDSLPTFPSSESDPFAMTARPDVYFAGNCEEYATRLVGEDGAGVVGDDGEEREGGAKTRLICVPSFAATGEAVLVKLRSLECEVLKFDDATL